VQTHTFENAVLDKERVRSEARDVFGMGVYPFQDFMDCVGQRMDGGVRTCHREEDALLQELLLGHAELVLVYDQRHEHISRQGIGRHFPCITRSI